MKNEKLKNAGIDKGEEKGIAERVGEIGNGNREMENVGKCKGGKCKGGKCG